MIKLTKHFLLIFLDCIGKILTKNSTKNIEAYTIILTIFLDCFYIQNLIKVLYFNQRILLNTKSFV